jgi:hypothetical protein
VAKLGTALTPLPYPAADAILRETGVYHGWLMYEHHKERLLSRTAFLRRLARHVAVAVLVVVGSLVGGMAGYVRFEGLGWLDAFLNAAMLLGGMGPIWSPATPGGKVFAGVYALYAGMLFLVVASIILAPLVHRVLHRFHWEGKS